MSGDLLVIMDGEAVSPPAALADAIESERAAGPSRFVPVSASKLGLKRAFGDRWPLVRDAIAADPERQEEWSLCVTVSRTDPLVVAMIDLLQLSDAEVDDLLVMAGELTSSA